ncbi:MAG: UvrD-helicase domain-containing protein [Alphaproteobacteria bacterium]|nr:UvrD-helicase domain-containing protein [Alphaproteobacteria bacterium]
MSTSTPSLFDPPEPSAEDQERLFQRFPYLRGLNPMQQEAVTSLDGPLLVLAGAGTGKTRVLTTRLAHLIATGKARPHTVLAVTFTNKAAREMKDRVVSIIGPMAEQMWLGTFHAIGVRILRRHAEMVGLKSNFTILDTDDQIRLLKQVMAAESVDDKRWPARILIGAIQRWKDRGLMPDKVPVDEAGDLANGKILELYKQYQQRLVTLNACDFGDLLLHCLTLFQGHPDVLAEYQNRFQYILVDEYQDTNVSQYLWLRLLAQKHQNICCVGDDDQSIYGWRGAEVGNILKFEGDFKGAKVIRLEQNYRSTGHILAAAHGVIRHNEGRLGKELWTEADHGEKVGIRGVWDGEEEARVIGDEIEALQRKNLSLNEIAILVRAGFQTREFEDRMITLGLPYRVVGGPRFYERQEIRDAMAYLRVIAQPDDDLAFERIVNVPKRGLGNATVQAGNQLSRAQGVPLTRAMAQLCETDEIRPQARRSLARLMADFDRWRGLVSTMAHPELAELVLDESGYTAMWQADKSPEAPGRLENLKELVAAMHEFESLAGFLEHVSLVMENSEDNSIPQISIMTLHSAKGLEFEHVFLPGWEEGVFPNQRAMDENGNAGLEEERRLAYVGITRAKTKAHVFFAANRRMFGQWQSAIPSRFVSELPDEHVERTSDAGLYGSYGVRQSDNNQDWRFGTGSYFSQPPRFQGAYFDDNPANRRDGGMTIEGSATRVQSRAPKKASVKEGDRVFHQKFGYGKVIAVDADKLEIDFDKAGVKKVIESFVIAADQV